jgi:MFS family permease
VIFTIAISFLLIGLTNKQFGEWEELTVGGFILAGIVGILLFILAEARATEPIIPLYLFRNRTYASSMVSTFFASFAFFGAIVFLPRWFQFVHGFSPTNSGLAALPLMVGLIFSSIVSGLIVARTGRYKWLLVSAIVVMGVSTLLMTNLTADTPLPIVWFWMFLAGLGVGPTFSVFTIVVQNAVPFSVLGVATSNLTFFRQIGGSVALAIVGTIFGSTFIEQVGPQLSAAGVPPQVAAGFGQASASGALDFNKLTGVGDLGAAILGSIPAAIQPAIAPYITQIVAGIHQAFSLAVGQTFWVGVGASIISAIAASFMTELALRTENVPTVAPATGSATTGAGRPASAPDGTTAAVSAPDRPAV